MQKSVRQFFWEGELELEDRVPGTERRTGAWSDINGGDPKEQLQRTYLSIAFKHGAKPRNTSYAYVLLPENFSAILL